MTYFVSVSVTAVDGRALSAATPYILRTDLIRSIRSSGASASIIVYGGLIKGSIGRELTVGTALATLTAALDNAPTSPPPIGLDYAPAAVLLKDGRAYTGEQLFIPTSTIEMGSQTASGDTLLVVRKSNGSRPVTMPINYTIDSDVATMIALLMPSA